MGPARGFFGFDHENFTHRFQGLDARLTGVEEARSLRRLVERGVGFVQLYHEAWDQHGNLVNGLKKNCKDTDQACAALIKDLKARGLLEDTLVLWGGEFGRTPMTQGDVEA